MKTIKMAKWFVVACVLLATMLIANYGDSGLNFEISTESVTWEQFYLVRPYDGQDRVQPSATFQIFGPDGEWLVMALRPSSRDEGIEILKSPYAKIEISDGQAEFQLNGLVNGEYWLAVFKPDFPDGFVMQGGPWNFCVGVRNTPPEIREFGTYPNKSFPDTLRHPKNFNVWVSDADGDDLVVTWTVWESGKRLYVWLDQVELSPSQHFYMIPKEEVWEHIGHDGEYRIEWKVSDGLTERILSNIFVVVDIPKIQKIQKDKREDNNLVVSNLPNPFNPSTKIQFSLKEPGHTTLRVYNTLGQEIVTLVDEYRLAGKHSVIWDASGVPSGMYFYRIQTSQATQKGRMMFLK